jgi:hypothetical protein
MSPAEDGYAAGSRQKLPVVAPALFVHPVKQNVMHVPPGGRDMRHGTPASWRVWPACRSAVMAASSDFTLSNCARLGIPGIGIAIRYKVPMPLRHAPRCALARC